MKFLTVKYNKHDVNLSYRSYFKIVDSFSESDRSMLLIDKYYQISGELTPSLFIRYLAISNEGQPAGYLDLDEVNPRLLNISFGVAKPFRGCGVSNILLSKFIKEISKFKRMSFERVNWFCRCENSISNYLATKYKFEIMDDWVDDTEFNGYYLSISKRSLLDNRK